MSMVGFHITEACAEVYLQNESSIEFLQLAKRLHDYLWQEQRLPSRSVLEATDGCKEISHEAFDALAKRRMENTGEISGVFELEDVYKRQSIHAWSRRSKNAKSSITPRSATG